MGWYAFSRYVGDPPSAAAADYVDRLAPLLRGSFYQETDFIERTYEGGRLVDERTFRGRVRVSDLVAPQHQDNPPLPGPSGIDRRKLPPR